MRRKGVGHLFAGFSALGVGRWTLADIHGQLVRPFYSKIHLGRASPALPIHAAGAQHSAGVAASILEGLDEMLTVNRLGLPGALRRSLACTNSIENMMGTRAPRLPQREAMAKCNDGPALDSCWDDRGGQGLPAPESLQALAHSQSCACSTSRPSRRHTAS